MGVCGIHKPVGDVAAGCHLVLSSWDLVVVVIMTRAKEVRMAGLLKRSLDEGRQLFAACLKPKVNVVSFIHVSV